MPSHSLLRLTQQIYNRPQLITPQAFDVILDYLETRNDVGIIKLDFADAVPLDAPGHEDKPYADGLGVLAIDGSLTYKPVMSICGEVGTSYKSLVQQTEEMAEAGVRTIVMEVTSGGGEAAHCFETCNEIRAIADENNIKLIGYADTQAASAAYALTCVCDEVIANPSASLGSIGCVVSLMDTSEAYKKAGLKRIFITSGKNKVPFDAEGAFKQEFLDEIQESVNKLNSEFAAHVSHHTGLSVETIKGFQAGMFDADEALELGLANKIMTNKAFAKYVAEVHKGT